VKIAVCIKRTPGSESCFRIAASGTSIDETGLKFDIDDFASYAVEVTLQLNEKAGGGDTVVYAVGPDSVQETLRKAMSMGAARAVQLKSDTQPADVLAVAKALAAELSTGGYDLVLFGKHAFDTSAGIVGTATAELLGIPCVTAATKLDIVNGRGTARRELEGAAEIVEFPLPAAVTIDEGIARPRYPSLKGIMAAKKKPLEVKAAQLGETRVTVTTMELPPDRCRKLYHLVTSAGASARRWSVRAVSLGGEIGHLGRARGDGWRPVTAAAPRDGVRAVAASAGGTSAQPTSPRRSGGDWDMAPGTARGLSNRPGVIRGAGARPTLARDAAYSDAAYAAARGPSRGAGAGGRASGRSPHAG
jgi:electron transfer flavoprotein beta subunit